MSDVALQVVGPDKYQPQLTEIAAEMLEESDRTLIYITTNKPYSHVSRVLEEKGIDVGNIFFIDCISAYLGEKPDADVDNCFFIDSPENLTDTSIAIDKAIEVISGEKVLLLDSLSVLLVYNQATRAGKFASFIANKMRASDVETVILALESDMDTDVINQIKTVVDEVRQD